MPLTPTTDPPPATPSPSSPRPFRYLADPICIASILLYCLGRWYLKPHHIGGWFVHDYLNDLLCLPLFLPIILRLQSLVRIRRHNLPPTLFEVLHNWAIFSILFEVILPRLPAYRTTADPWNVVAYLTGGLLAYAFWHRPRQLVRSDGTSRQ